jgi:catechol 2,3-dioxygenase-like lactoylglutathione lyase family enzyme
MRGRLHHVEVNVSNLGKSRKFWGWFLEKLGYRKYQEWKSGMSWRLGPTYIVFVQTRRKYLKTAYHRSAIGLNHLAFHARSRREVDLVTEELRARGTSILYEDDHPFAGGRNHYAVFFEDPDRIKVELVAPGRRGH